MRLIPALAAAAMAVFVATAAMAMSNQQTTPSGLSDGDVKAKIDEANAAIAGQKYDAAIEILRPVVDTSPDNADAHNLLGYSYRKLKDWTRAERSYGRALRIEPKHLGALEYSGELYLETERPREAEALLARLREACPKGCEELAALEAAFARAGRPLPGQSSAADGNAPPRQRW